MSDFLFLKDFITPLCSAAFGTAAGAAIVNHINNQKIESDNNHELIRNTNISLTKILIYHDYSFGKYLLCKKRLDDYLKNGILFQNNKNGSTNERHRLNLEKTFYGNLPIEELLQSISKSSPSSDLLVYSSFLLEVFQNIRNLQNHFNNEMDTLSPSGDNEDYIKKAHSYFGIKYNGITNLYIESLLNQFIYSFELSILTLNHMGKLLQKDTKNLIKSKKSCFRDIDYRSLEEINFHSYEIKEEYPDSSKNNDFINIKNLLVLSKNKN